MDASASAELENIIEELKSIISELQSISDGLRNDFEGIGTEVCAATIDTVTEQYVNVKKKLENMDTTTVKEGFIPGGTV